VGEPDRSRPIPTPDPTGASGGGWCTGGDSAAGPGVSDPTACLDLRGASTANGGALQQYTCHPTSSQYYPNQLLRLIYLTGTTNPAVSITINTSGKVADIAEYSTADGGRVHQWDWTGTTNQRFTMQRLP
jgi:hypothetical protein